MGTPDKCLHCQGPCTDHIEFLMGLSEDKQRRIMESAVRKQYPRDGYLFREEDPVDAVYIIHSGRVKLSTWDSEGREQIVGIFSDHDTIWEGIFMEESRYPYGAVCLTEVDCCKVLRRDLEAVMEDTEVALRVIGLLSQKLHDANERIRLLATSSPRARLAGFLLQRSRHTSRDTVVLRLDDIAASIHLRPETVSRRLREMERDGLIEKVGQSSIRIRDRERLEDAFRE